MQMILNLDSNVVSPHCVEFTEGLSLLRESDVSSALKKFQYAYRTSPRDDFYYNKYTSYYGLTRVLNGDRDGVEQCRYAASREFFDGDVFLNLAYAEWYMNSRERSVDVLHKGLEIDQHHPGLNKLKQHLGNRTMTMFNCIPRDSFLNRTLGKLSRRKVSEDEWEYWRLM